jgi:tripartite ATP-independent transporter DctP family solute receptor
MLRLVLTAALVLAATATQAQVLELKLGNTSSPTASQTAAADEFARRVNAKLPGKVKVTVFANSQLGNENELLQKLKIGTVDFSQPSTIMSTVAGEFGVFDMPYLIKDRAHMARYRDEVFWKEIAPKTEAQGLKVIAVWENGFRHITNNVRPIDKPEDLKGVKLRVPPGVWRAKMFQAYGASPSPMQFSELFVALQTGVMDGQENPLTNIWGRQAAGSAEVPVHDEPCLHAVVPDRRRGALGKAAGRHPQGVGGDRPRHRALGAGERGQGGEGALRQAPGQRHQDQYVQSRGLREGERIDLRGVRQAGAGRQGAGRQGPGAGVQVGTPPCGPSLRFGPRSRRSACCC